MIRRGKPKWEVWVNGRQARWCHSQHRWWIGAWFSMWWYGHHAAYVTRRVVPSWER